MVDLACRVIRISNKCSCLEIFDPNKCYCLEIFDQQGNPDLTSLVAIPYHLVSELSSGLIPYLKLLVFDLTTLSKNKTFRSKLSKTPQNN